MAWILLLGLVCLSVVGAAIVAVVIAVVLARQRRDEATATTSAGPRRRPAAAARPRAAPVTACPECGGDLPDDAPEGLCPQCLLKGAIGSAHDAAKSAGATAAFTGPPAPSVEELAPLFPQLELIELIGQGGMGAVYKARQSSLDRLVAVKVLPREAGQDPAFAERFSREARTLARLGHPNIVAIHDVGKAGEFYYFVMEYVDGANLRQVLRDGHLTPEQALRIVPQICDALQYAHEEGVVHRDIKPENILLDRKGRVKIADFGLAKLLGRDTGHFTLTGSRQVMGTLYYMAPEQVERPLEVDHRADIYSLGVVFYELLTGRLPVGHFPLPSEKAGTDAFLDDVVLRSLEREPERRYQHASDVKTDLRGAGRRPVPRPAARPPLRRLLRSTTAWASLCCLVGLAACSLSRWIDVRAYGLAPQGLTAAEAGWQRNGDDFFRVPAGGGEFQLIKNDQVQTQFFIDGAQTWQGSVATVLFLLLGVFLIATGFLNTVPLWRPLTTVAVSVVLVAVISLFLARFDDGRNALSQRVAALYPRLVVKDVQTYPRKSPYVALAAALGLVVLGAAELYRATRLDGRRRIG